MNTRKQEKDSPADLNSGVLVEIGDLLELLLEEGIRRLVLHAHADSLHEQTLEIAQILKVRIPNRLLLTRFLFKTTTK